MELEQQNYSSTYNFSKNIFENISYKDYKKLIFTNDSIYSSSKTYASKKLIDIIIEITNNNKDIIITDGTTNIGCDSINLSYVFKSINSIELDIDSYNALNNNINILNVRNNIKTYNGDVNIIIKNLNQDIIYIDAPWGGKDYKKNNKLKLYISEIEILDFYLTNIDKCKYFIFKIPYNYDFDYLKNKIINKYSIYPIKKNEIIKFFILVIFT